MYPASCPIVLPFPLRLFSRGVFLSRDGRVEGPCGRLAAHSAIPGQTTVGTIVERDGSHFTIGAHEQSTAWLARCIVENGRPLPNLANAARGGITASTAPNVIPPQKQTTPDSRPLQQRRRKRLSELKESPIRVGVMF
jgi:hypothetical protein